MNSAKLVSNSLFYTSGYVYAIGGNSEGTCERYNVDKDVWQKIPSFAGKISGENSLYTYASCMIK